MTTLVFKTKEEIDFYYNDDFKSYQFYNRDGKICDIDIRFNFVTIYDIIANNIKAMSLTAGNIDAYGIMAVDVTAKDIECKYIIARNLIANDIKGWCTITAHSVEAADIIATEVNAHGDVISYGDITTSDIKAWGSIRANSINYFGICSAYGDIVAKSITGRKETAKCLSLDGNVITGEDAVYKPTFLELNSVEDMMPYFNSKTNCFEFVKPAHEDEILKNGNRYLGLDIQFNFDLDIKADIRSGNIKGKDIRCFNIDAYDITAQDIGGGRIYATDINCRDINNISVEANYIKCRKATLAEHIDVNNIDALEMIADTIKATDSITCRDIDFTSVCYAHNNITCGYINGMNVNSKYFVLNGEIKIKDGI